MEELICRLCKERPADSSEHVVLNALGGKREVVGFLCTTCNNERGNDIDAVLESAARTFAVPLGCRRGDGEPVAPLKRVHVDAGYQVDIPSKGRPDGAPNPAVGLAPRKDGGGTLTINAKNMGHAARLLAHQAKRFGRTPEQLFEAGEFESVQELLGPTRQTPSFGGPQQFRSVVKMGLAAIAKEIGPDALWDDAFEPAASFVNSGEGEIERVADHPGRNAMMAFAEAPLGCHVLVVFNEAVSDTTQVAFSLFGVYVYRTVLTGKQVLHKTILHVVDPIGHQHSVSCRDSVPPLRTLAEAAEAMKTGEKHEAIAAVRDMGQLIAKRQLVRWTEWAIEESFQHLVGRADGDPITQEGKDGAVKSFLEQLQIQLGASVSAPVNREALLSLVKAEYEKIKEDKRLKRKGGHDE